MTEAKQPWPAEEIVRRKVDDLIPYARNARKHSKEQVAKLAASIKEWGWTTPVLIAEDGTIIAGHGRVMAARQLAIDEIPCMVAKGWSEAQKKAYVIADNQLALDASWDREMLRVEVGELAELDFGLELLGFGELELKGLMQQDLPFGEGYDKEVPVPENPVAQSGDVWLLGKHRLMCGDSTDENAVAYLLDGAKPLLMVTDPPYGVDYDPEWRQREGVVKPHHQVRTGQVSNDDRVDWTPAWQLFPGDVAYVWHGGKYCGEVAVSLANAKFEIRTQIIWNKGNFVIGRGAYHWRHEPCWYAVRKGKSAKWIGDRTQSTVWDIKGTDDGDKSHHSTQKPIECMGRPIRNHDAEQVYDPFAGSGSTLIACELMGRQCFAMELEPGYVDVIIQRWQDRTNGQATREKDGAVYSELAPAAK